MSDEENIKYLNEEFLLYYSLILLSDSNSPKHEYISNIKNVSDQLIKNYIYCDAFMELESCERLEEYIPVIENIITSLNLPSPKNVEQAVWFILKYWIGRIASIKIEPIQGLELLIKDVYWTYDFQSKTKEYLGDSHGIEYLIGLYWEYDDLKGEYSQDLQLTKKDKNYKEINDSILVRAKEWIKKYNSINPN